MEVVPVQGEGKKQPGKLGQFIVLERKESTAAFSQPLLKWCFRKSLVTSATEWSLYAHRCARTCVNLSTSVWVRVSCGRSTWSFCHSP